ncbi:MAG TPA: pyridoxal-phosphate dependent enzyme [Myxococcota bacterium]|nr:pyridoxal-phosphate dependent enzyme [Myxococcota bacterium]
MPSPAALPSAPVDLAAIHAAAARIAGVAHRTPIETCATLDRIAGRALVFKCEQLQKVGAFKFRGACNAVSRLDDTEARRGVVTHSSGNHAQAVALAARLRGIPAHIVMPAEAPAVKRRAVEGYGARVVPCEMALASREATAERVRAETGATLVHPYDSPDVIAGQGTAALERLEQAGPLDAIVAPVGGGGLVAGTAIAATAVQPGIRIFAAEPAGADDAARSKRAGVRIPQTAPDTVADGLITSLGELTWPILRDRVEDVLTVSELEILAALRLAWERAKLLIEPSAAVALAAVLSERFRALDGMARVGVILTGGNVDFDRMPPV